MFRIFAAGEFVVPARPVTRVFLHCTASENPALHGVGLVDEIDRWHKQNGWAGVGYHFVVDRQGQVMTARNLEVTPAAQLGADRRGNIGTIAICTHGNWSFTPESMVATRELCAEIHRAYADKGRPVTFHGHREIDPKPCPVYGYRTLLGLDASGQFGAQPFAPVEVVAQVARHIDTPVGREDAPPAPRNLQRGDHGDDVNDLQSHLAGVLADGDFGPLTETAVRGVQRSHGLADDGIVGPNTRAALGL